MADTLKDISTLMETAKAHMSAGHLNEGEAALREVLALDHTHSEANFRLGQLAEHKGQLQAARKHYQSASQGSAPPKNAFLKLAGLQAQAGQTVDALSTMRRAEMTFPDDKEMTYIRGRFAARETPLWHLPMLADKERNARYQSAIEAAVKPEDIVLDIGTGSGLLALMAARAGVKHVYACESHPILAGLANDIIRKNGYEDQITILAKHSNTLKVGVDLPEKADVLVTEIFDNAMIGEGILPTMEYAWAHLLKPGASIIPNRGVLYGQIVSAPHLTAFHTIDEVSGFDLSLMSALSHPFSYKDIDYDFEAAEGCRVLSAPFKIWDLDLTASPNPKLSRDININATASGMANALLMWFDLHLAEDIVFSTENTGPHQHWRRVAQLIETPMPLDTGKQVRMTITYDRYFTFDIADTVDQSNP